MGVLHYLFSFKGRINRAKLWLFVLISFLVQIGIAFIDKDSAVALGNASLYPMIQQNGAMPQMFAALVLIIVNIGLFWADIATTVKRLHDREKSGWWILVFKVLPVVLFVCALVSLGVSALMAGGEHAGDALQKAPIKFEGPAFAWFLGFVAAGVVFSLWGFIELYCMAGTDGSNPYGIDPLEDGPVFCEIGNPVYGCTPKP